MFIAVYIKVTIKQLFRSTVNSEIFANTLFLRIVLKDTFATYKIVNRAWITYISKRQSDIANSQGLDFHETSHKRSFAKIKLSRNFPNWQYLPVSSSDNLCKQFGSRSGPTKCRVWYGSKLFDTDGIPERIFLKSYFWKKKSADSKKSPNIFPACWAMKMN